MAVKELHVDDGRVFAIAVSGDNRWCSAYEMELIKTEETELVELRELPEQVLLLKSGRRMYYLRIQENIQVMTEALHLCPGCCHCSALASSLGCQKVRDTGKAKQIEKYNFILSGYEVLNGQSSQTFVVSKCRNFEPDS